MKQALFVCVHNAGRSRMAAEGWGLDDPAGQPIETVRQVRGQMKVKVAELLERES